ncbi:MAG TPA: DegV family EDD domain-containing protein, partial [Campylobacterales bacterium]|nr:DegV family EDD domain-containing protein [Campylobacterales bacterium]
FLTLSSKLSGTYLNAQQVAQKFKNKVKVFDTLSISLGISLMAVTALDLTEKGYSYDEILLKLERKRDGSILFFSVPTLKYLIRGGRVGKIQGIIGSLLHLKLLMALEDGLVVKKGTSLTEKGEGFYIYPI